MCCFGVLRPKPLKFDCENHKVPRRDCAKHLLAIMFRVKVLFFCPPPTLREKLMNTLVISLCYVQISSAKPKSGRNFESLHLTVDTP